MARRAKLKLLLHLLKSHPYSMQDVPDIDEHSLAPMGYTSRRLTRIFLQTLQDQTQHLIWADDVNNLWMWHAPMCYSFSCFRLIVKFRCGTYPLGHRPLVFNKDASGSKVGYISLPKHIDQWSWCCMTSWQFAVIYEYKETQQKWLIPVG